MNTLLTRLRQLAPSRRGAAAVEFALIGFAFFAFIFAIVNLGLLGLSLGTLSRSVQATARWAAVQASASYAASGSSSRFTLPCLGADAAAFNGFTTALPPLVIPASSGYNGATTGTPSLAAAWSLGGIGATPGIYLTLTASYDWKPLGFAAFTKGIPLKITTAATAMGSAMQGASVGSSCN